MTTSALPETTFTIPRHPRPRLRVVAHRGASASAPENTLSAVRAAVAAGADEVEIDVRRTRDGKYVVFHDARVGRTTNVRTPRWGRRVSPRLDELTLAELRRLDAGAWKGPSFRGERIPTLAEVLELVAATRMHLLVEVKRPVGSQRRHLRELVGELDESVLPHHRLTVQSFDEQLVHDLRDRLPSCRLAVLTRSQASDLATLSRWADQVSIHHRSLDRRFVEATQGWGMRCVTWTVNDPAAMRRATALGVDGVITDHPNVLSRLVSSLPTPDV